MTCFDCKFYFGSKFTSSAEGRRFNWLIYDSMTSLFVCGRFSKSRGLSASVSFLPSFPFLFPLFYSLHSSPCNSLLPNCTETLATQATLYQGLRQSNFQSILARDAERMVVALPPGYFANRQPDQFANGQPHQFANGQPHQFANGQPHQFANVYIRRKNITRSLREEYMFAN